MAIAGSPSLTQVAVAWPVGATTAGSLSSGVVGRPAVTLVSHGLVVSSTLKATAAQQQTRGVGIGVR